MCSKFLNIIVIFQLLYLVSCSSGGSSNKNEINFQTSTKQDEFQRLPKQLSSPKKNLTLSETELAYEKYWLDNNNKNPGIKLLKRYEWLFDSVEKNNGHITICLEFDFKGTKTVSESMIDDIQQSIENGVNKWKEGLNGYKDWAFDADVKLHISAIAKSTNTQLEGAYDTHLSQASSCDKIKTINYDFKVKFSDYNIGSRGYAGNWGIQLRWYVFLQELESQEFFITYHELGHVMGLPDIYTYPDTIQGRYHLSNVRSIMANNGYKTIQDIDWSMLRKYYDSRN